MSVHWDNPLIARVLRRLASFTRLITFDQQGLGCSDPIDVANPPTFDDLVTDLETVMVAAEVRRPGALRHAQWRRGGDRLFPPASGPTADRLQHLGPVGGGR